MTDVSVVKKDIVAKACWLPIEGWTWRMRGDEYISPRDMETRHLFMTLRMIWNHTMPQHMNVGNTIKRYDLSDHYTPKYLRQAIQQIGAELFTRRDMTPLWKSQLDEMAAWFARDEEQHVIEAQKALTDGRHKTTS